VIPEELPDPGDGGGEVDRAEHQHPRRRSEGVHEHAQLVAAALAVGAVPADAGQPLREHAPDVVVHRGVQPAPGAQGPGGARMAGIGRRIRALICVRAVSGPDDAPRADLARSADHRRDRDRLAAFHRRGNPSQLRKTSLIDWLDKDVEDSAAGQAHRERVVITHAVGLKDGVPGLAYVHRQLVDGAFDASAGHAADDLAARRDG
jgi:hypothetical protein